MMLEEGEKLIRTFKDEMSGMVKVSAGAHKGTIVRSEAGIGLVNGFNIIGTVLIIGRVARGCREGVNNFSPNIIPQGLQTR